jgi:hypothetical protein
MSTFCLDERNSGWRETHYESFIPLGSSLLRMYYKYITQVC